MNSKNLDQTANKFAHATLKWTDKLEANSVEQFDQGGGVYTVWHSASLSLFLSNTLQTTVPE